MKKLTSTLLFSFMIVSVFAQINNGKTPYSFRNTIPLSKSATNIMNLSSMPLSKSAANIMTLSSINLSALQAEDAQDKLDGNPPRFGYPHTVNLNLTNSGTWQTLTNGNRIWTLEVYSASAKSINLLYDKFWLPEGAEFYIYNAAKTHSIGGFTSKNNKGTKKNPKKFGTGLVFGDRVILEYYEPQSVSGQGIISIAKVVHGYRYINIMQGLSESAEGFGDSGSCQVNINCPEGNDWQKEKTSVALILVDGNRWCTGSLINNTKNDSTLYFLTANHCLDGWAVNTPLDAITNPDGSDWSFYWNYESPNCSDGIDFIPQSTCGATLIANNAASDFALFRLTESPYDLTSPVEAYFNGWERNNPSRGGVGIHHPSNDIKKIATHNMIPINGRYSANSHWRVNWVATTNGHSVTEGGSSGSPLYNSNSRIIGQLHGGSIINCTNPSQDPGEYGKFSTSWNNSTDRRRRLKDWLDPTNSNAMFLDGKYTYNPTLTGSSIIYNTSTATYTLKDAHPTATVTWSVSSNLKIISSTNTNVRIKHKSCTNTGEASVSATINNGIKATVKNDDFT